MGQDSKLECWQIDVPKDEHIHSKRLQCGWTCGVIYETFSKEEGTYAYNGKVYACNGTQSLHR